MDDTSGAESTTTLQAVSQTGYGKLVFGFPVGFFMQDMCDLLMNP